MLFSWDFFSIAQLFFVYVGAQVLASFLFSSKISFTITFSYHFCAREYSEIVDQWIHDSSMGEKSHEEL
jgi:hypothetical protein